MATASTKFPLGIYVGNPGGSNVAQENAFESQFNAFVADMGGARPTFMDAYTDFTQDPSQWASNAQYGAWTFTQTGSAFAGPGSGMTPVVGVPLASNAGGWSNVDTFYKQIIAGQYDGDYKGIVDAWAKAGYGTVQFRIAYEFNGSFMPWSPGNSSSPTAAADFVAAFQHVATLIHTESAVDGIKGQVVWNPADINNNGVDPTTLYAGDKYVDIISTDTYSPLYPNDYTDWSGGTTKQLTPAAWGANAADRAHFWQYTNGTQYNPTPALGSPGWSFQDAVNFALLHNKPLSVSEAGSGPAPSSSIGPSDDPAFPQWLAGALAQAQAQGVTIQNVNIWDTTESDGDWNFTNGSKPLAAAAWGADFGAASGAAAAAGPVPVTLGTGPDSLVLQVSEDAWSGDAQFTIAVDGKQVGGTQTTTAARAAGQAQAFTVLGTFAPGNHTATVTFVNDAYGGSAAQDRNLYVGGATVDGAVVSGASLAEYSNGTQAFGFQGAGAATPAAVTIGSGSDSLVLLVSEDAWNGDAQFTIAVDGKAIGGTQTVIASHGAGQTQAFTVLGAFGAGSHTATVAFLNDAYGGTASQDRNLYVAGAKIDGVTVPGAVLTELSNGAQAFGFAIPSASAPPITIGAGSDSLVLQLSEDAWNGDAQFTVAVDGAQVGGMQTARASHAAGQTQAVTVLGTFGPGGHTATVSFLNDAYGGSAAQDRNLYVSSATVDGATVAGASLTEYSNGAQSFAFKGPAAAAVTAAAAAPPSITFTDTQGHSLAQAAIATGTLDSGAWQTGLNNNVHQSVSAGVDTVSTESFGLVDQVQLTDLAGGSYALQNFVETDVHLAGGATAAGAGATLAMGNAQRGTVAIDGGNYAVTVNAISGSAGAAANTFAFTLGAGTDSVTLTGSNRSTVATIQAGSGTDSFTFIGTGSTTVSAGSGIDAVSEAGGSNSVIVGTGTVTVTDGSGADLIVYHAGAGLAVLNGFSPGQGDALQFDASLQATMHQSVSGAGLMISFGADSTRGVLLQGVSAVGASGLHWT